MSPLVEDDKIERRFDLAAGAGAVGRDVIGNRLDVFLRGQLFDDELLLEGSAQPDTDPAARGETEERNIVEQDRAVDRREKTGKDVEQGRLAGAVGADQAADRRGEFGVEGVKRLDAAELHRERFDLDHDVRCAWNF
jgi:hypothetical protein